MVAVSDPLLPREYPPQTRPVEVEAAQGLPVCVQEEYLGRRDALMRTEDTYAQDRVAMYMIIFTIFRIIKMDYLVRYITIIVGIIPLDGACSNPDVWRYTYTLIHSDYPVEY